MHSERRTAANIPSVHRAPGTANSYPMWPSAAPLGAFSKRSSSSGSRSNLTVRFRETPDVVYLRDIEQEQNVSLTPSVIHPFVALVLPIRYDIRCDPSTIGFLSSSPYYRCTFRDLAVPIMTSRPLLVKVVCMQFPWVIDVGKNQPVTCLDVLLALHNFLQVKLADHEWNMADKEGRERMARARKRRIKAGEDGGLKRVDWLGGHSMFLGLEKDNEFAKRKLLSGYRKERETWVVRFGRP